MIVEVVILQIKMTMLTIIIRTVVALPVYSHPQTKARVGLVWDLGYCWLGTLNLEYC